MDPTPGTRRALIRFTAAGVLFSAAVTAATFTGVAEKIIFLRYPLLGAAMAAVIIAGWRSGRLPAFNRTLWAHAPWWARLSWLAILAAALGVFATISRSQAFPAFSSTQGVLEARGIGAVTAYLFLIASLRGNVDASLAKRESSNGWGVD